MRVIFAVVLVAFCFATFASAIKCPPGEEIVVVNNKRYCLPIGKPDIKCRGDEHLICLPGKKCRCEKIARPDSKAPKDVSKEEEIKACVPPAILKNNKCECPKTYIRVQSKKGLVCVCPKGYTDFVNICCPEYHRPDASGKCVLVL